MFPEYDSNYRRAGKFMSRNKAFDSKFQIPETRNPCPKSKTECPLKFWNLESGIWNFEFCLPTTRPSTAREALHTSAGTSQRRKAPAESASDRMAARPHSVNRR